MLFGSISISQDRNWCTKYPQEWLNRISRVLQYLNSLDRMAMLPSLAFFHSDNENQVMFSPLCLFDKQNWKSINYIIDYIDIHLIFFQQFGYLNHVLVPIFISCLRLIVSTNPVSLNSLYQLWFTETMHSINGAYSTKRF